MQKRAASLLLASAASLTTGFFTGHYFGGTFSDYNSQRQATACKEAVIQHLRTEGFLLGSDHIVFDTLDLARDPVSATGMFRTTEPDRVRVGRFWIELTPKDSTWIPKTIIIKSASDSYSDDLRWP